jgi:diadenosine tetraphosphate (Ap4A) HIT family hydrolase
VVRADEPLFPGFLRVIWRAHVGEMTDLTPAERSRCMQVVCKVESVLRVALRPDKVNLASLGNQVPHLHWHVIPRFRDDPCFPDSVWSTPRRAPGPRVVDWAALTAALVAELRSAP